MKRGKDYLQLDQKLKFFIQMILIMIIISVSQSKFMLDEDHSTITEQAIMQDPLVEVQGTSKHFNIQQYDLTHLKFMEAGKNKRNTYEIFIRKYKKIIDCLIKNHIIPHQTAMIHSGIQMNFNNKKRLWEFSRVFVVYSDKNQLHKVLKYLQPFKLTTLKQRIVMGYLNQKLLAIKAFTDAKTKLQKFLKKKLNTKLQIVYIVDIEIKGKKFINEEDIQSEIKKQNNYSTAQNQIYMMTNENKSKQKQKNKKPIYAEEFLQEDAVMKVLFKVGDKNYQNVILPAESEDIKSDDSDGEVVGEQQDLQISPQGQIEEQL